MAELSPTSVLLGANWTAVLDIAAARERLDQELLTLLFAFEPMVTKQDWWSTEWEFRRASKWVFIRNVHWTDAEGSPVVSMGVRDFAGDRIFGSGAPPLFYIWASQDHPRLRRTLLAAWQDAGYAVLSNHRHILHRAILQCPSDPAAIGAYPAQVYEQLVGLFTEYAGFAMRHDADIRAAITASNAHHVP